MVQETSGADNTTLANAKNPQIEIKSLVAK